MRYICSSQSIIKKNIHKVISFKALLITLCVFAFAKAETKPSSPAINSIGSSLIIEDTDPTKNIDTLHDSKSDITDDYFINQKLNTTDSYVIIAKHSNKVFDVTNGENSTPIVQYSINESKSQQFKLVKKGNGYYSIISVSSGKALDIGRSSTSNGAKLIVYTKGNSANQQFKLIDKGNGYCKLQLKHSGKYLDVARSSKLNNASIIQYTLTNNDNQLFKFSKVRNPINTENNSPNYIVSSPTMNASSGGFNMILASDPQYPRTPDGATETDAQKKESEKLNRDHVKSMNAVAKSKGNTKAVIINGDLTEYGHLYQLKKFKEIYNNLSIPMYLGLGNHDYANNVDNTFSNQASTRMVEYQIENIVKNNISGADYNVSESYTFPEVVKTISGSLSYSWDEGNVHFVQLHNYPLYTMRTSDYLGSDAKRKIIEITSSLEWLEKDLRKARKNGKVIILNYHDSDEHWAASSNTNNAISDFTDIIFKYNVSAVFVGHYHDYIGEKDVPNRHESYYEKNGVSIPVFYCGSAVESKYLFVNFDGNTMTVENIDSTDGATTSSDTKSYNLTSPTFDHPAPRTSGKITFFNESGYVAKYRLSYKLNGKWIFKDTGNMALGNKKSYIIPKEAVSLWVKGEGQTGLLWDPWNITFEKRIGDDPSGVNTCYKSYGTTLNQKWNNNCK